MLEKEAQKEAAERAFFKKEMSATKTPELNYDHNGRPVRSQSKTSQGHYQTTPGKKLSPLDDTELRIDCKNIDPIQEAKDEETPLPLPEWARNPYFEV